MPLDYLHPDEIVLGKDLKPGDCVRGERGSHDMGIIIATTFVEDKEGKRIKAFYEDAPAIEQYDINCPCDGGYTRHLDPEKEFKVIRSRKDILYTYEKIEHQLLSRSADLMNHRNDLMVTQKAAVNRMNDRCDRIEKILKYDRQKHPNICENSYASVDGVTCEVFDDNHSCPAGYAISYTKENCPELKKIKNKK